MIEKILLFFALGTIPNIEAPIDDYREYRNYKQGIQYQHFDILIRKIPYHVHMFDKDSDGKPDVAELRVWGLKGFEDIPRYIWLDKDKDNKMGDDELVDWEEFNK